MFEGNAAIAERLRSVPVSWREEVPIMWRDRQRSLERHFRISDG